MGCGQTKNAPNPSAQAGQVDAQKQEPEQKESMIEQSAEEKALTQLKLIFKDMDQNSDGTVNKEEFTAALQRNDKLSSLMKEANMSTLESMQVVDTNKDGLITWAEFENFLKGALSADDQNAKELQEMVEEAAEIPARDQAHKQLKKMFDGLRYHDSDRHDPLATVSAEELVDALKQDNGLADLLVKAEFKTLDIGVLCEFDTDKDGLISWQEFVDRLEAAATKEIQSKGELAVAVQIEDEPEERATGCGDNIFTNIFATIFA